jgi:hypothetical protein
MGTVSEPDLPRRCPMGMTKRAADALKATVLALGALLAIAPAAYAQDQAVSSPGVAVPAGHHPQAVDPGNGDPGDGHNDEENSGDAGPI